MAESLGKIVWAEFEIAVASFFIIIFMPVSYSISTGIAAGFIFYCLAKIVKGKAKDVHPILYIVTGLFILSYLINALV